MAGRRAAGCSRAQEAGARHVIPAERCASLQQLMCYIRCTRIRVDASLSVETGRAPRPHAARACFLAVPLAEALEAQRGQLPWSCHEKAASRCAVAGAVWLKVVVCRRSRGAVGSHSAAAAAAAAAAADAATLAAANALPCWLAADAAAAALAGLDGHECAARDRCCAAPGAPGAPQSEIAQGGWQLGTQQADEAAPAASFASSGVRRTAAPLH